MTAGQKWQVWVRLKYRRATRVGVPVEQSQAIAKVAELKKNPKVRDAWCEEEL